MIRIQKYCRKENKKIRKHTLKIGEQVESTKTQ
jgi:hypothetical protein